MPFKITLPFYAVKLKLSGAGHAVVPLGDDQVLRIDQTGKQLADKFANAFQESLLDKGSYKELLHLPQKADYQSNHVAVSFKASKDKLSHPQFELEFDYFYRSSDRGLWASVPALSLNVFAENEAALEKTLKEAILLEFARNRRLDAVQEIVSTIWFENIDILEQTIDLKTYTPSELTRLHEQKKEEILPKVAQKLNILKRVTYGRDTQVAHLARTLKGRFAKNILLVGASGVGKTALVWELARQKRKLGIKADIFETTASTLIKELTGDTGWQDNLAYLCKELATKGDILFIRNLLELFEVGQYEGNSVSMADYLREYMSRGEITIITECTREEFARIELRSQNYTNLFQVVQVIEPKKDLEDIIIQKVSDIAHTEKLTIEKEAIKETIRLNRRFTPYSGFPGKPIRFLESIVINHRGSNTPIIRQKDEDEDDENTEKKKNPKKKEKEVVKTVIKEPINRSTVIQYFCEETGMPRFMVDPAIPMDLEAIQGFFHKNIFGQDRAINATINLLAEVKAALAAQGKPIASLLFVGPTGVGKTEMAKVLAHFMFGSRERMIRFDMSEFSDPYSVARLTGTSYHTNGLLTSAVRREPFSVILFDEIEKASPVFYDLLLQMLGEGRLTDSRGKLVNFCSTIIIMTSNIGAGSLQNNPLGWANDLNIRNINDHFMDSVRKHFRPEMFNRMDQVVPFSPLTKDVVRHVVHREMNLFQKREGVKHRKMDLILRESVYDYLAEEGYEPKYGARQLQRVIRERLIIPLAKKLNINDNEDHLVVTIDTNKKGLVIDVESDPLKFDLLLEELTRIEYADYASDLRRDMQKLKEGSFYVQLLSDLDIMERQKRRLKERFWHNAKSGQKYTYYLDMFNKVEKMTALIEKLEMELDLTGMDLQSYRPQVIEDVKNWKEDLFKLKLELFVRIQPQSDTCYMSIYSLSAIDKLINIYFPIFIEKEFEIEAHTVWYRESYYNEVIKVKVMKPLSEGSKEMIEIFEQRKRNQFYKRPFDYQDEDGLKPKKSDDQLLGIEFRIKGTCPFLYLSNETGFHRWQKTASKYDRYVLTVTENPMSTPPTINRTSFYGMKQIRRTYTDRHIDDSVLNLKREVQRGDYTSLLLMALDMQFVTKLDEELL